MAGYVMKWGTDTKNITQLNYIFVALFDSGLTVLVSQLHSDTPTFGIPLFIRMKYIDTILLGYDVMKGNDKQFLVTSSLKTMKYYEILV